MSNQEEAKKEPEKKVPAEKERTFLYTFLRMIACVNGHTLFPVKYHHKERFNLQAPYICMSNHQSAYDPVTNSDMAAMRLCAKTLRDGYVLGIFPEGTRHHKDLMEEVETGAAVLALRAKVPILPVYIESKPRFLRVNHVYIGEPMDISDLCAQGFNTEVVEALCSRIRDTFFELRKECQERK